MWSNAFKASLNRVSNSISYRLRFLPSHNNFTLGNAQTIGMNGDIVIGEADVIIDSARITPQRWSVNFGGFSITLHGDISSIHVNGYRKGAIAELWMDRGSAMNRVAIGQLDSLSGGQGIWRLEFTDLLNAMRSRATVQLDKLDFWYNAGKEATVTSNFTFSIGGSMFVSDTSIFEKRTGKDGLIKVIDATHNAVDYWTFSGKGGTYLTISSNGNWPSLTAHGHLHAGDTVVSVAWLYDRPDYIFAALLMSTGNGTQGQFDYYPASWGFGVDFNPNLINKSDMDFHYNLWKTPSGDHEFYLALEQSGNIRDFLDSCLSCGMWPVFKEGRISWRCASNPNSISPLHVAMAINDSDIVSINEHQIYSSNQSVIYGASAIRIYNAGSGLFEIKKFSGQTINTLPASNQIDRDHAYIYDIKGPSQDITANADLSRLYDWDSLNYEELSISVKEKFACLVAGDIIEITSSLLYGYRESQGQTYFRKRGMILGNRWLPAQGICVLTIGVLQS